MNKQVTRIKNEVNSIPMREWNSEEMNFFFAILTRLRDEGIREIVMDKYELAELAAYTVEHNQRYEETMRSLATKIQTLTYWESSKNSFKVMPLFTKFEASWNDDLSDLKVSVKVNEEFEYILNQWNLGNWTAFQLKEFTSIKSTYSKTLFRLLKQWKNIGRKDYSVADFKRLLSIPDSYTPGMINKRIVTRCIKDLAPFFPGIKVKAVQSNTRGNPITSFYFSWIPQENESWDENKYQKEYLSFSTNINYKRFTQLLVDYNLIDLNDEVLINNLKIDVYPIYQKIYEKKSFDDVEKHVAYMSKQNIRNIAPYLKKSAKQYLRKELYDY